MPIKNKQTKKSFDQSFVYKQPKPDYMTLVIIQEYFHMLILNLLLLLRFTGTSTASCIYQTPLIVQTCRNSLSNLYMSRCEFLRCDL